MFKKVGKEPKQPSREMLVTQQKEHLQKQRDVLAYRMNKLSAKQQDITKKTEAFKEKIRKKYKDMRRVLDDDLQTTLSQLDMEQEACRALLELRVEQCYTMSQELEQHISSISSQLEREQHISSISSQLEREQHISSISSQLEREQHISSISSQLEREQQEFISAQNAEMEKRISETLKQSDPALIQMDEFKNEQLLSLTLNLLLFIRSQLPVTRRLFQCYAADVALDPDSAHPKLTISPRGDTATYTDTWQEVPETAARFDTALNAVSRQSVGEGRHYWEVEVSGKTYWELGLTHPGIPRKGREEHCWLGRGGQSWCVEYFHGDYTAWHDDVPHELAPVAGRRLARVGVYCSFPGGLVSFYGADTMTPLHCFCAGTFTDVLLLAVCPGHDNQGTNWKPLQICNASRSAPML